MFYDDDWNKIVSKRDQIFRFIYWQVVFEKWKVKDKIFTEQAMAIKFNCSRMTVRNIYQTMYAANLLNCFNVLGYFIKTNNKKKWDDFVKKFNIDIVYQTEENKIKLMNNIENRIWF